MKMLHTPERLQFYLGRLSWGYREMYYIDLMRVAKGFGKRFRINTEFEILVKVPPIAIINPLNQI
jgi:hypothetical protein